MTDLSRRSVLRGALAGAASLAMPTLAREDLAPIYDQIGKRHDEAVKRLQDWIRQPSIAAETSATKKAPSYMIALLREAGFRARSKVPTDGQPGVFATLDAGAPKTLGLYFMYDVKQVDPKEWSSPPLEARAGGQARARQGASIGRGAVNQKGPEGDLPRRAARHPRRGPQAAGEPRPRRRGRGGDRLAPLPADRATPEVAAALKGAGLFMPMPTQAWTARSRQPGRQGRDRAASWSPAARSGAAGRPRTCIRQLRGDGGQPGLAPGAGAGTLVGPDGNTRPSTASPRRCGR